VKNIVHKKTCLKNHKKAGFANQILLQVANIN